MRKIIWRNISHPLAEHSLRKLKKGRVSPGAERKHWLRIAKGSLEQVRELVQLSAMPKNQCKLQSISSLTLTDFFAQVERSEKRRMFVWWAISIASGVAAVTAMVIYLTPWKDIAPPRLLDVIGKYGMLNMVLCARIADDLDFQAFRREFIFGLIATDDVILTSNLFHSNTKNQRTRLSI